jgi:hypothetical protein
MFLSPLTWKSFDNTLILSARLRLPGISNEFEKFENPRKKIKVVSAKVQFCTALERIKTAAE